MPPLKVVFDTNIFVMAAGMPGGYIDYWLEFATPPANKFQLYTSPAILGEVQEKLEVRLKFERALAVEYVERLKTIVTVVNPTHKLDVVKTDPDDNMILECAIEAKADLIISADKDLLKLKQYEQVQIHHPSNLKYIFQYLEATGTAS
jgi:putative PIN family toxin of toxin-antitoxin system